jgi:hypothetical protein
VTLREFLALVLERFGGFVGTTSISDGAGRIARRARFAGFYRSSVQVLHSVALNGGDNGAPVLYRMIPSDVEQKFLVLVPVETGVAVTEYSLQGPVLQSEATSPNWYPGFAHHPSPVQAKISSTMAACCDEEKLAEQRLAAHR